MTAPDPRRCADVVLFRCAPRAASEIAPSTSPELLRAASEIAPSTSPELLRAASEIAK